MTSVSRFFRVYARNIELEALKRGWSQDVLATRLGVSRGTLARIRRGDLRYLDPEILLSLLQEFNCTPNDLLMPQEGIQYDEAR